MSQNDEDLLWGRSSVDTACPLDCPDSCSLSVSLEKGRIVEINGSNRSTSTNGYICAKVRRFNERIYGESRIHHAGIRSGQKGLGEFRRASWNQALDLIAKRMTEIRTAHGSEAILPFSYGGSNGLVTQNTSDAQLFRRFGTSRLARTVCAAPTTTANQSMYGRMPSVSYTDYDHSKLIVVWGANPPTSGIHLLPHIRTAVSKGAALLVIDPRKTNLAKQADIHLQVQPGTDVAIALAFHRFLFENDFADHDFLSTHTQGYEELRTMAAEWPLDRAATVAGIDPELLERAAELYAETSPAVIRCGWGLERNKNGGNAALAVLALPSVAGKFGVRGGGYSMSNSGAWRFDEEQVIDVEEPNTRLVNMNKLGRALTEYDPPIRMLFVYNCNPAVTIPDQNRVLKGLQREDLFTVVFDQVMTDTARWADVVLPATTFLEHYDLIKSYGPISLQLIQPVIEPVSDSRPNVEVFGELAKRLGIKISSTLDTDPEALTHVASTLSESVRNSLLDSGIATPECPENPVQFLDVFPRTPDRKVNLFPKFLEEINSIELYTYRGDTSNETYPLALISPATSKTINSTLGELRERLATLEMHPSDAGARNLRTGDTVRVFNELGEIHCPVKVNPDMRPGTVGLPKGLWRKSTMNGATATALVADSLTDIGGGACFNDARVEVTRIVTADLGEHNIAIWATGQSPQIN